MAGTHRSNGLCRSRILLVPLAAGLLLAACSSSSPSSSAGSSTTTTSAPAAATASCVTNPAKVIATLPTAASTVAALPTSLVTRLNSAVEASFKTAAAPGAIVGVRTPQGTWTSAYGFADPTTKTPMTTDMHMRIGSVTKTFTGTLILQLAQEGKLSLNDTVEKYYPGIPNGNSITLGMLANMTSGIASYFTSNFVEQYFGHPETVFTPDGLIAYGVAESPIFAPGAKFNYSNTNTVLLGKIIEKVTGAPVADVFQQQILGPLGMTNTTFPSVSSAIPDPHPQGYTLQGLTKTTQPINATNWSPSFGWTAGAMISNLQDLFTYDQALATGQRLLSPETQTQRLDSFAKGSGYGLALGCIAGWVGHTGELPGFNTTLYYDTTTNTSVVVMVNSDIPSGNCPETPTLTDNPTDIPCSSPATRIFVDLSKALGHTFGPIPSG
jgi:D-alanyl-D-alanine carboxypeptidase